jgi:GT2 family glycosyltransferase
VIDACVDAIDALPPPVTTIVVDNQSQDDSVARLAAAGILAIDAGANLGFAAAVNLGARQASAGLLCLLNPDCEVTAAVVSQAIAALDAEPRCVAVPVIRHDDGAMVAGRQPGYSRRKLLADLLETAGASRTAALLKRWLGCDDPAWHWPLGACLFVRREFFVELGGLDEDFFMYMEDVQFGMAVRRAGGEVLALDAVVRHRSGQGSDVPMARRLALLDGARIQFAARHYGRWFAAMLRLVRRAGLRAAAGRA